jgi:hypothetical protein
MMATLTLKPIWRDDDGMLQLELSVENSTHRLTQDFYAYPEEISRWAEELCDFPSTAASESMFEFGIPGPNSHCHGYLPAFVIDGVGHAAIEVSARNFEDPPNAKAARFSVLGEPSAMNRLGWSLRAWTRDPSRLFQFEWEERT